MAEDVQASWSTLPRKSQLFVLALCRFAEPLSNTSVLSYLFYLLQSFDHTLTASEISRQAGFLVTSFALGQFLTGTIWGSLSDSIGRKWVLMIGLAGTVCSTLLFGFSHKLWIIIAARSFCGLVNGNVGVLRTMISEIVVEKKHQSRAFLIMPMCFNVGAIVGPIVGGLLANPTARDGSLHWLVGPGSYFGGKNGVQWLQTFPYALPNIVSAMFLSFSLLLCWLFLEESHPERASRRDYGLIVGQTLVNTLQRTFRMRGGRTGDYMQIGGTASVDMETLLDTTEYGRKSSEETLARDSSISFNSAQAFPIETNSVIATNHVASPAVLSNSVATMTTQETHVKAKYSQILTSNVILTLVSFMLCPLHNATFMQLWPLFLSTPTTSRPVVLPIRFGGGLGLSTSQVGYAMATMGFIGVTLQILIFPRVQAKFGTLLCYRISLWIFPIAYTCIPYLSVLPSQTQDHASGPLVWAVMAILLLVQVIARTFALPSTVILLNNCAPSRKTLGTIHGLGSSLASLSRVIGPLTGAFLFGHGIEIGVIGLVWWTLACVAICGAISSLFIHEGPGQVAEPRTK